MFAKAVTQFAADGSKADSLYLRFGRNCLETKMADCLMVDQKQSLTSSFELCLSTSQART